MSTGPESTPAQEFHDVFVNLEVDLPTEIKKALGALGHVQIAAVPLTFLATVNATALIRDKLGTFAGLVDTQIVHHLAMLLKTSAETEKDFEKKSKIINDIAGMIDDVRTQVMHKLEYELIQLRNGLGDTFLPPGADPNTLGRVEKEWYDRLTSPDIDPMVLGEALRFILDRDSLIQLDACHEIGSISQAGFSSLVNGKGSSELRNVGRAWVMKSLFRNKA